VTGQYAAAANEVALRRFVERDADLLVTDGPLSEESLAPHAKEWASLAVRSVPIGSETIAIVVHPANKVESVTLDQLRDALTGKVREWWLAQEGGAEIKRFGPSANDEALVLLAGRLAVPRASLKIEHRPTAAEVVKAVSADPRALGIMNLADVPAEDSGVRVMPVVVPGLAGTQPSVAGPSDPKYPFAREWILQVRDRAQPTARLLGDRLSAGAWGEAIRAIGLTPAVHGTVNGF
jgi:ABC-type phosphate transport system substrate-binding protein